MPNFELLQAYQAYEPHQIVEFYILLSNIYVKHLHNSPTVWIISGPSKCRIEVVNIQVCRGGFQAWESSCFTAMEKMESTWDTLILKTLLYVLATLLATCKTFGAAERHVRWINITRRYGRRWLPARFRSREYSREKDSKTKWSTG